MEQLLALLIFLALGYVLGAIALYTSLKYDYKFGNQRLQIALIWPVIFLVVVYGFWKNRKK